RAAFEVIRDFAHVKAPPGVAPVLVPPPGGGEGGNKIRAHVLLDEKSTKSNELSLTVVDLPPGCTVPRHSHDGASELAYVVEGSGGTLEVGSEKIPFAAETALYLPAGQPHAAKMGNGASTRVIQIFAPAGPEQEYRDGAKALHQGAPAK